jgi:hypothetical protein
MHCTLLVLPLLEKAEQHYLREFHRQELLCSPQCLVPPRLPCTVTFPSTTFAT